MRLVINRFMAIVGAVVALAAIMLIVLLESKQRSPGHLAGPDSFVGPILLFAVPLLATVTGFMIAAWPGLAKRFSSVSVGLSMAGTLNLLLLLASLPIRRYFSFGPQGMVAVIVVIFGCLLYRPTIREPFLVDHVYYTAGVVAMTAIIIGRSYGPLPALVIGIGPLLALVHQARGQALQPAAFIGLWAGVASLFGVAFLDIAGLIYFFMAAVVIVFCGLVVQFTAGNGWAAPERETIS